jgi:hypothetical protein
MSLQEVAEPAAVEMVAVLLPEAQAFPILEAVVVGPAAST